MEVDEEELADFGLLLGMEGYLSFGSIGEFAKEEGLSADGFDGLLEGLGKVVSGPAADLVDEAFLLLHKALSNLGDALVAAAKQYGHVEETNKSIFERTELPFKGEYKRYLPKGAP